MGFESIMQALGLAAWRGGGRTGDQSSFIAIRDTFIPPDLLKKAKDCRVAELDNVALLFYTRHDEEGGRGYEFLHKSFGEFLTACGLLNAFIRWGNQVKDNESDFGPLDFFYRRSLLTQESEITEEVADFLRNEVRLCSSAIGDKSWKVAREWVDIATSLVEVTLIEGIPVHKGVGTWRQVESRQMNSEEVLIVTLDACARAAYPLELFEEDPAEGGWVYGPVDVKPLRNKKVLSAMLGRLAAVDDTTELIVGDGELRIIGFRRSGFRPSLSRMHLQGIKFGQSYSYSLDLSGANLEESSMSGMLSLELCEQDEFKAIVPSGLDFSECRFGECGLIRCLNSARGFPACLFWARRLL